MCTSFEPKEAEEERKRLSLLNSSTAGQPFHVSEKGEHKVDLDSGVICILWLYKIKAAKRALVKEPRLFFSANN